MVERNCANLFAPMGAMSDIVAPYHYRYYPQTNAYLATSSADNHVYYLGPVSNNSILDVGRFVVLGTGGGLPVARNGQASATGE